MSVAVLLPRTGSTSSDVVTVVEWRVSAGDVVEVDDVVAEVETDKSTVEIVSSASGTVLELCVDELGEVSIGDPLLYVGSRARPPRRAHRCASRMRRRSTSRCPQLVRRTRSATL